MNSQPILSCAELRIIEKANAEQPLMERAGWAAAQWATELALDRPGPILICAGPGNNGGDAMVVARHLLEWQFKVEVVFSGDPSRLPPAAAEACRRFREAGGVIVDHIPETQEWRLIVDGVFGIGMSNAPRGIYADWIGRMNRDARTARCPLLALDCPTGLDAETGKTWGETVNASHTLTFIAMKAGLLTGNGPDHCGELRLAPLDLELSSEAFVGRTIGRDLFSARLQRRRLNTHKGSFGGAGVIGGAHSMIGAVLLAGRAALRLGAGRVYLGALAADAPSVDPLQPELMFRKPDAVLAAGIQSLACGPGLGTSLQASALLEHALSLDLPLVLDADALNLVSLDSALEDKLVARSAPTLLTPHPAEAARLLDVEMAEVLDNRRGAANAIAARFASHVVLKGCGSVVAAPDGRWWINTTGGPALATAGTGDVLTGFAVSLLAQGWDMESATLGAVHLHGAAADALVASGIGPVGVTAGETIDVARNLLNRWIAGD